MDVGREYGLAPSSGEESGEGWARHSRVVVVAMLCLCWTHYRQIGEVTVGVAEQQLAVVCEERSWVEEVEVSPHHRHR